MFLRRKPSGTSANWPSKSAFWDIITGLSKNRISQNIAPIPLVKYGKKSLLCMCTWNISGVWECKKHSFVTIFCMSEWAEDVPKNVPSGSDHLFRKISYSKMRDWSAPKWLNYFTHFFKCLMEVIVKREVSVDLSFRKIALSKANLTSRSHTVKCRYWALDLYHFCNGSSVGL